MPAAGPAAATAPVARPHVLLSCAVSLDGYLDDATATRLVLSNDADWDRIDQLRADSDAILVGAGTIRADNPRLAVRSDSRRSARLASGRPEHPLRVVLTTAGDLDPASRVFTASTVVYTTPTAHAGAAALPAEVVPIRPDGPQPPADLDASLGLDLRAVLADLSGRGVARLMVEGGGRIATALLTADLVDELQLAVAPFFVGDPAAPRFAGPGAYPSGPGRRLELVEAGPVGDMALLRYRR
jgi:5-amino-6-(5-phosphoribosylamino)uracil reductase